MRAFGGFIALALAISVLAVAVPAAQAASCGSVRANAAAARAISATGLSCSRARTVLRAWVRTGRPYSGPRGWRCSNSRGRFNCRRGGARLSYTYVAY